MTDKSYTILAKGLWCRSESDWDQSSDSDEYYAIITTLAAESNGTWHTKTIRVPKNESAFEDVDDGEFRKFEVVAYEGPLHHFQIGAQLMEEDEGSSDQVRKLIADAAAVAIKTGSAAGGFSVPESFADEVAELVPSLFGLGDDTVDSYQTRYFSGKQTVALAASKQKATKPEGCRYRFRTWHVGGGSHVVLYYDIFETH